MQNNPASTLHKTTHTEFTSLFGQTKLVLDETPKAITPFAAYLAHKAVFTHSGVSTQVCTLGVIQDESALKWATANIALQGSAKRADSRGRCAPPRPASAASSSALASPTRPTSNPTGEGGQAFRLLGDDG